jgi:hypothetical protein
MQTPLSPRPPLIPALDAVKLSRRCNMFDSACVILVMRDLGYSLQADWLEANLDNYLDILIDEYQQWMQQNPSNKSLAQQVARETGLEVVED